MSINSNSNSLPDVLVKSDLSGSLAKSKFNTSTPVTTSNNTSTTTKTQTVFIHKLYDMLEDPNISHLIWWSINNDSFCLLPGEEFSKVLAQYFKHTNIASFIRQLNMYGFHKVNDTFQNDESSNNSGSGNSNPTKWEFRHSTNQFRKGDLESLKLIKRRSSKNVNSHKEVVNLKSIPTSLPLESDDESKNNDLQQSQQHSPPTVDSAMQSHSQQQSQSQHVQQQPPPLMSHSSFEHSINFKFIELNSNFNNLKNDYQQLHSKYDLIFNELKKSQTDIIHLLEILERYINRPTVKKETNEVPDRSKNNITPINMVHLDDNNTSPMSRNNFTSNIEYELSNFKSSLLQRLNRLSSVSQQQQTQQYHLNSHQPNSRNSSNSNIVPQRYPLNPHYTVYPHEVAFRQVNLDDNQQQQSNRHLSVLMDPLQPVPSRHNSNILYDDNIRLRSDSKSYSPLTISGSNCSQQNLQPQFQQNQHQSGPPLPHGMQQQQQHIQPMQPIPSSHQILTNIDKKPLSRSSSILHQNSPHSADLIRNYHQYPFPIMPINDQSSSQQIHSSRTNSLPNSLVDSPTSELYKQRNSLTSVQSYDQQQHPSSPGPQAIQATSNVTTPSSQLPRSIPSKSSNSIYTLSSSSDNSSIPKPPNNQLVKNQLPSVSELDKSIKIRNPQVYHLLNNNNNQDGTEDIVNINSKELSKDGETMFKKRKF